MTRALLSLGSNLGDRYQQLRSAVAGVVGEMRAPSGEEPAAKGEVLAVSGVYETPPWGDPDQPTYFNAVVLVAADVAPRGWLELAARLERAAGRERDPQRRFGPRTLDVDVIAVWTDDGEPVRSDDPELTLPHPRAHLRAFVLRPWVDIAPYAQLPEHGFLTDLLRTEAVAADLPTLVPRPDLPLTGPPAPDPRPPVR